MTSPLLLLVSLMAAQGNADDAWEKVLLLQKVKRHLAEELKRMPDYTCLQTSARYRRQGLSASGRRTDTVVLEVLNAGEKEFYTSPGERAFEQESPSALTAGGMMATGSFGLFLRTLFVDDNATFQYRGEGQLRGRDTINWEYRVPRSLSGYLIRLENSRGVVGMKGVFAVDADTLDLLQFSVIADDIPPTLELLSSVQNIDYAPMRIGSREVNLPQSGSLEIVEESGAQSRNIFEFTHCQSFGAQSSVSYTLQAPGPKPAGRPPGLTPLSPGLTVRIELAGPIGAAHPVGALFEGRVVADVRERGKKRISAGAQVRGRIRRLESVDDEFWAVGLEFTEIETDSGPARFYANVIELDKRTGAKFILRRPNWGRRGEVITEENWLPYLPGVAQFYVPGRDLHLPKGFQTVWKTTSRRPAIP